MLLVVTNRSDPSSDLIVLRLEERRLPFFRFNTDEIGDEAALSLSVLGGEPAFTLTARGKTVSRGDVEGVYFRDPRLPQLEDSIVPSQVEVARREIAEQLRSLWRFIPEEKWLNHPRKLWLASNKIEQLLIAARAGLRVPRTLVTSDLGEARGFIESLGGEGIVKAVRHGFDLSGDVPLFAPTRRITSGELEEGRFARVPTTFQELVPKRVDLRVTLVDDKVFATAIHSQDWEPTSIDWRMWDIAKVDLRHEAVALPRPVEDACRAVARKYGLRYAAIDLVRRSDGEYVFLEMNPNGQWAWIEEKVNYNIRDAIVDALLS